MSLTLNLGFIRPEEISLVRPSEPMINVNFSQT